MPPVDHKEFAFPFSVNIFLFFHFNFIDFASASSCASLQVSTSFQLTEQVYVQLLVVLQIY